MSPARPVVLVPGLWMPAASMRYLGRRLELAGYSTRAFGYRSVRADLDANLRSLARFLEQGPGAVDFIGHSLGGVLVLAMLARSRPGPGRVVCLGSPLAGSRAGEALARYPGGRLLLGRSLAAYAARPLGRWDGPNEVGVIAGRRPLGGGRLLTDFPGPNDGTVAVEETRLPGIADHITLDLTHMAFLCSAEAARQARHFLEHGRFAHERLASVASS